MEPRVRKLMLWATPQRLLRETSKETRGEKPVGVLRVLRALDAHLLKSPDDLHRIAYEYLEDAASHGVRAPARMPSATPTSSPIACESLPR